jgi:hypothetical protein
MTPQPTVADMINFCVSSSSRCKPVASGALTQVYSWAVKLSPVDSGSKVWFENKARFIQYIQASSIATVFSYLVVPLFHGIHSPSPSAWLTVEPFLANHKSVRKTLEEMQVRKALPSEYADLFKSVKEACDALYKAGINHCDAHVDNIMVSKKKTLWDVKFIDYDWVSWIDEGGKLNTPLVNNIEGPAKPYAKALVQYCKECYSAGAVSPTLDYAVFMDSVQRTFPGLPGQQGGGKRRFPVKRLKKR